MRFTGQDAYHRYEGLVHKLRKAPVWSPTLEKACDVFENHGTLITGRSTPECFLLHHYLERAYEIQIAAMAPGMALKEPPTNECLQLITYLDVT